MELASAFNGRRLCENTVGLLEEEGLSTWTSAGAAEQDRVGQPGPHAHDARSAVELQEDLHPNYWGQLALRNCLRQAYNGGTPRGGTCGISGTGLDAQGEPNMTLQRTEQRSRVILSAAVAATDTRSRIMTAALACFLEDGYEQATVARIRERSGASNGALFHHFHSKEAIADALHVEAIASFQEGLWELLRTRPRSLRAAVRATIEHQLRWIEATPSSRASSTCAVISTGTRRRARRLLRSTASWRVRSGSGWSVRGGRRGAATSMLMITAIVSGPAHGCAALARGRARAPAVRGRRRARRRRLGRPERAPVVEERPPPRAPARPHHARAARRRRRGHGTWPGERRAACCVPVLRQTSTAITRQDKRSIPSEL